MNRKLPLQTRYANIVTPDFNNIQEEQDRCQGCERPMWPEDNAGDADELYCEPCATEMNHEYRAAMAR